MAARVVLVAHRESQPGVGHAHDLSAHRIRGRVTDQRSRSQAGSVHHHVGLQVHQVVEPGDPTFNELRPGGDDTAQQVREIDRHLHQRHRKTQARRVAGRQFLWSGRPDRPDRFGPPRQRGAHGRFISQQDQGLTHAHTRRPGIGLSREFGEGRGTPARDRVRRPGFGREPDRRRQVRGRALHRVGGHDDDVVARGQ